MLTSNFKRLLAIASFFMLAIFGYSFAPVSTAGACAFDDTCVDERLGCNGTVYTFSCASDICNNQTEPQCYICVSS